MLIMNNTETKSRPQTPVSLEEDQYSGISHSHFKDRTFPQVSKLINHVDNTEDSEDGLASDSNNEVPVKSIRNGYYQEIFWLGCSGYIIFNHHDKEILLVDPWSSYRSFWNGLAARFMWIGISEDRPLVPFDSEKDDDNYEDKINSKTNPDLKRIEELANCIREFCSKDKGYTLTGILLSHMHYDHADDVPILLELLSKPEGDQVSHTGLKFNNLRHDPITVDNLPPICCDYDTRIYLQTHYWNRTLKDVLLDDKDGKPSVYWKGKQLQREMVGQGYFYECTKPSPDENRDKCWNDICTSYGLTDDKFKFITVNSIEVEYDDVYIHKVLGTKNSPKPGTKAKLSDTKNPKKDSESINIGSFSVVPYIWDHMNTGLRRRKKSSDDQVAGHCQRMTAFLIQRKNFSSAKKTFIIGSAGGMENSWTKPNPIDLKEKLEIDLLLQAINGDGKLDMSKEVRHGWRYANKNFSIKDFIVFTHWEDFVKNKADTETFKSEDNFKLVRQNIGMAKRFLNGDNKSVIENNGIFILGRCGSDFENLFPAPKSNINLPVNFNIDIETSDYNEPLISLGSTSNINEPHKTFSKKSNDYTSNQFSQAQNTYTAEISKSDLNNLSNSILRIQSHKKHVISEGKEKVIGEDWKDIKYNTKPYPTEEMLAQIYIYVGEDCITGESKSFDQMREKSQNVKKGINTILIRLTDDKKKINDLIIDGIVHIKDGNTLIKSPF